MLRGAEPKDGTKGQKAHFPGLVTPSPQRGGTVHGDRQAGGWLIAARARQLSSELQTRGGPIFTLAIWSQFDPHRKLDCAMRATPRRCHECGANSLFEVEYQS